MPVSDFSIILNAHAGVLTEKDGDTVMSAIRTALAEEAPDADLRILEGEDFQNALKEATESEKDRLLVGGGDGTVNAAAALCAASGKALGILPMGTLNLYASDLGIPADMGEAVRALLHGEIRRVDYAEVNGRLFLCNSIIGILPPLMEKRESLRGASDFARNAALLKLGYKIFKRSPRLHVTVNMDGTGLKCKVRGIAICNNDYHDAHSLFPHKAPLDAGKLKVYLPPNPSRRETVRILLRVLLGTWRHDRDIIAYETQEVTIETRRRRVRLVIDGEPEEMEPPLNYHIRPRALRVIVPPGDRGGTSMR